MSVGGWIVTCSEDSADKEEPEKGLRWDETHRGGNGNGSNGIVGFYS